MFRRHWSGLPEDPEFPADLEGLGYFINDEDEFRSIQTPNFYFKYFLDRHPRINERQRFMFDHALERVIHKRLEEQGLQKVTLPLGPAPNDRQVPVFVSSCLDASTRVVVFFGQPSQDLGVLAGRVVNGPGGIDKGRMVSVVRALQGQASSATDSSPPGVILANTGQLYWWPEGKRALTPRSRSQIPLPSMVHLGRKYEPGLNTVPRSETPARHVSCVFDEVIGRLAKPDAMFTIVAIEESCELVTNFLDEELNWATWGHRLSSMILLGHADPDQSLKNPAFKAFLAKRTRAYLVSDLPLDTALAPPVGNAQHEIPGLGCPCFSSEPVHGELIMIHALKSVLWYAEVAATVPAFENPLVEIALTEEPVAGEPTKEEWAKVPDHQRPGVTSAALV